MRAELTAQETLAEIWARLPSYSDDIPRQRLEVALESIQRLLAPWAARDFVVSAPQVLLDMATRVREIALADYRLSYWAVNSTELQLVDLAHKLMPPDQRPSWEENHWVIRPSTEKGV